MKTSRKYTRELKRQFGYFATWLPGTPLKLGDIGVIKKNTFRRLANISDLRIPFEIIADTTPVDIEYNSEKGVSVTIKAAGNLPLQGSSLRAEDAGITVEFSKKNAILFKANGVTNPSIKNQVEVGEKILSLYKKGKWNKDWVVITELAHAKSGTVLISSSSKGEVELKANAEVQGADIDIANSDLNLEIIFHKDVSTRIVAQEALTPLFKASQVKTSWFGPDEFENARLSSLVPISEQVIPMDLMTPEKASQLKEQLYFGEAGFEEDHFE